jgi:hypothetical protein
VKKCMRCVEGLEAAAFILFELASFRQTGLPPFPAEGPTSYKELGELLVRLAGELRKDEL